MCCVCVRVCVWQRVLTEAGAREGVAGGGGKTTMQAKAMSLSSIHLLEFSSYEMTTSMSLTTRYSWTGAEGGEEGGGRSTRLS